MQPMNVGLNPPVDLDCRLGIFLFFYWCWQAIFLCVLVDG
ncbi:hypothetical protein C1752_03883 [Acaryochloris thomasi RCC1774]|uniref:Uncharacterized protein n=1 Tax=Acaryochloris thomasi RCC1774 TaxID=1764569 RepID=A0A2W1JFS7_9CYAN|nr:hypothetical protein C1752_03883 [Acaryochloris thomasi RCC1774]